MDKLDPTEINEALKDVRNAYRLLALYQQRILDTVKYIANSYNVSFNSGWTKFSKTAANGHRADINKSSWDWLTLYLYEFNLGGIKIADDQFNFKVVHQADTGYFDASEDKKINRGKVEQFENVTTSKTRLFFVISKNDNGCPMQHILNGNLKAKDNSRIIKGNWLAIPFDLTRFSSQSSTDAVLSEFNSACISKFDIELISKA